MTNEHYYFSHERQFSFAPGVMSSILGDTEQRNKSEIEGYKFSLGDMDIAQSEIARHAVFAAGIDHTHPAGYLYFKSEEDRLTAIHAIHKQEHKELGWKWRTVYPRPNISTEEWSTWARQQPIEEKYLIGTTEDPNKNKEK